MAAATDEPNVQPSLTITIAPPLEMEPVLPAVLEGSDTAHKDVREVLQLVTSLLVTISLGLTVATLPAGTHYLLVIAHHISVLLPLLLGFAVLVHSMCYPPGPEAARRRHQKEALAIAIGYSFLFAGAALYLLARCR